MKASLSHAHHLPGTNHSQSLDRRGRSAIMPHLRGKPLRLSHSSNRRCHFRGAELLDEDVTDEVDVLLMTRVAPGYVLSTPYRVPFPRFLIKPGLGSIESLLILSPRDASGKVYGASPLNFHLRAARPPTYPPTTILTWSPMTLAPSVI